MSQWTVSLNTGSLLIRHTRAHVDKCALTFAFQYVQVRQAACDGVVDLVSLFQHATASLTWTET